MKYLPQTAVLAISMVLTASPASGDAPVKEFTPLQFNFSQGVLLATFHEFHPGMAAELQPDEAHNPLIRIYGDGRVLVHRPFYMKQSGDFEMVLSDTELDALLESLTAAVATFNTEAIRIRKSDLIEQRFLASKNGTDFTVFAAPNASVAIFRLYPSNADQLDLNELEADASIRRSWRGLSIDAEHYPEIESLQRLAQVERELHELGQSERLNPAGGAVQ